MPIDVEVKRSPGWWMQRLFKQLNYRKRRDRLQLLHDYYRGRPRLPQGAENVREMFEAFQRKACTNFAELIVSAVSERMTPVGFQTSVDDDVSGDADAGEVWERAGLNVIAADVHDLLLNLGEAFVIVGGVSDQSKAPVVTAEDPRFMVGESDPAQPRRLLAVLKVLHDSVDEVDRAYLYLPGKVYVAFHPAKVPTSRVMFNPRGWSWDPEKGGSDGQTLTHDRMPVVQFLNKDRVGEYEKHLDLLDRINHQILQRMVIATMQAFRQRAVIGLPDVDEDTGDPIDYEGLFVSDPAAFWQLPAEAKMWESDVADLSQILDAVKHDVEHAGAVTKTPMYMLIPSGQNQSAEGASLAREGLVFKVEDRQARTNGSWAEVMSLAFLELGQSEQADLSKLRTLWKPANRLSLTERADAASKASNDIPRRSRLIKIWGFLPSEADRMMTEWADDQLLAAHVAAATVNLGSGLGRAVVPDAAPPAGGGSADPTRDALPGAVDSGAG